LLFLFTCLPYLHHETIPASPLSCFTFSESMDEEPMSKIYRDLGIEPIINATGTYTAYSGSLMHPEVSDAMNQASRAYVVMEELHLAAGRRIAELIGVEAAHVCASATAGVALMGAACVAGCDRERIRRLPDIDGLKDEFIIQRTQRNSYEQAVRLSGGHFVEIEPDPEALRMLEVLGS
jgi:D-glucosaminate-6-phosphate ammonia-lyase